MPTYCQEEGCIKYCVFNYEGKKQKLYCSIHKKDGMVNVKNKPCAKSDCKKIPSYNVEGENRGLYCLNHKKDGMINVKKNTCVEPNCKTMPIYNKEGESNGIYCLNHKKDGMIDVISPTCAEPECIKQPTYNIEGKTKGLYCVAHKKNGMIDVKNKTCVEYKCTKHPVYNVEGEKKGLYCVAHKKDGMIDVKNLICTEPGCKKISSYNIEGGKQPLYCATHKKNGMINIKHKTCKSSWCETLANKKYEGYCLNCFIHLFPDQPNTRNYKTKEKATTDYIIEKYPNFSWLTDKKIQDGCSRKRPDLLLDLGYQVVIIEVDENQHQDYDCSCENKRLMELSQDVGHRPLIFIRFNPDEYLSKEGKVTSCWSLNGQGICTVKKTKQKEWTERLEALKAQIEYWLENKTEKTVEIIQLFYDCD